MTVARVIELIPTKSAEERRQMRENALRLMETGGPRTADAKAMLEASDVFDQISRRPVQQPAGEAMIARTAAAFRLLPLSPSDEPVLRVLLDNPSSTSEQLGAKLGWDGQSSWHLRFGALCRDRKHLLWSGPFEEKRQAEFYSGILADFDERTRGFTLKPEVVEAFAWLGLRPRRAP
jgi:hypothetical protein